MKKKLMMVAVLLGALFLGACVDDNESQSVTDVRAAKAEQLKSVAALNTANAQAALIVANAEKALKEAEAEYQKALAAAKNADAAEQERLTKEAEQRFVLEIDKLKAETEQAIAEAKQKKLEAEQSIATNTNKYVQGLYATYDQALGDLLTLNEELARKSASLAYLNAGVAYAKAFAQVQITSFERSIAGYQAQISVLKDPAYTSIDKTELYTKWQAALTKSSLAYNALYNKEGVALKAAGDAVKTAYDALVKDMENVNAVNSINYVVFSSEYTNMQYYTDIYGVNNNYVSYYKNYRINESYKLNADRNYASNVKNASDALGTSADSKDKNTAYGRLAKAKADLTAAQALPETTDEEKAYKSNEIATAQVAIAQKTDDLASYQQVYNGVVAAQKEFNDAFAAVDITTLNKDVDAIVAALVAQTVAKKAFDEANVTPSKLQAEANAMYALYRNGTNINEQIVQLESYIAEAQQEIEYYKGAYVTDQEVAKTTAETTIANLKVKIAAQQKIVDTAKAALDAALAAQ